MVAGSHHYFVIFCPISGNHPFVRLCAMICWSNHHVERQTCSSFVAGYMPSFADYIIRNTELCQLLFFCRGVSSSHVKKNDSHHSACEIYNFGLIHHNSMFVLVKFYFWMVRSNISGAKIYLIHSNFGASRLFCSALPRALWNIHLTYPIKLSHFKHLQTISFPKKCSQYFSQCPHVFPLMLHPD